MFRAVRFLIVLALLAAVLPAASAAAAVEPADPTCALVAQQLGVAYQSVWLDGAVTCIMYPPRSIWNKEIVLFAHGYVDARQPIGIPWDQLVRPESNLPALVLNLGYAFGTTSYKSNGLAVKDGVQDIVKLANYVTTGKNKARKVFLTGASEGGLVTALALEKYPQVFAGGLSTCGPVGSFFGQVQYWGDFRVKFDEYFPGLMNGPHMVLDPMTGMPVSINPSTPIAIDPIVEQYWEMFFGGIVAPQLLAADPNVVASLLIATNVPFEDAATAGESIAGLLYYNAQATNNARMLLNPMVAANPLLLLPPSLLGNPYENLGYTIGYPFGISRDPVAVAEIQANYETSGSLERPMVLMHTTGDPIIPFTQSLQYIQKATLAGSLSKLAYIPVVRYGHCAFNETELVLGFYTMVLKATLTPFSAAQIERALPDAARQAEFQQLLLQNQDTMR